MSKQQLLFDPREQTWVNRLWRTLHADRRRQVISILAEMGRAALSRRPPKANPRTGASHES